MREVTAYSLGNPGTFDITDKNDPLYYIARFNHEMSVNLYNLQQAGWEFRQGTDLDGLIGNNGTSDYPLLAAIGDRKTEILINQTGDLESAFFEEPAT